MLTINFLKDYSRYKVDIFSVNYFFNGLSNDISHFVEAEIFIISTYLRYVVIVCIFLRNCVFVQDKKNPPSYFVNVQVHFFPVGKENVYQSRVSKFFHEKRHSTEIFTKNDKSVKKVVKFPV